MDMKYPVGMKFRYVTCSKDAPIENLKGKICVITSGEGGHYPYRGKAFDDKDSQETGILLHEEEIQLLSTNIKWI